jgi:hypothetical protein
VNNWHAVASICSEEIESFGYSEADLKHLERPLPADDAFARRAHAYYQKAEPDSIAGPARTLAMKALDIYRKTLRHIEASDFDVFHRRPACPRWSVLDYASLHGRPHHPPLVEGNGHELARATACGSRWGSVVFIAFFVKARLNYLGIPNCRPRRRSPRPIAWW